MSLYDYPKDLPSGYFHTLVDWGAGVGSGGSVSEDGGPQE